MSFVAAAGAGTAFRPLGRPDSVQIGDAYWRALFVSEETGTAAREPSRALGGQGHASPRRRYAKRWAVRGAATTSRYGRLLCEQVGVAAAWVVPEELGGAGR